MDFWSGLGLGLAYLYLVFLIDRANDGIKETRAEIEKLSMQLREIQGGDRF